MSATGVPVTVSDAAAGVVVRADKRRLERVVGNLVDNADRHGKGLTAVTVDRLGDVARVLVDDNGPGVPADEREAVFGRFARGTGSRRSTTEGSGLGLALVRRHVQAMGGTVEITGAPGGGARFVVHLPVHEQTGGTE